MKVLGLKEVNTADLKLEGGWRARLKEPRVALRARSIERLGVIHEPVVRWSDRRPIVGRDRIAALVQLGQDRITVKAVECTDAEAAEIAAAENSERRHLTPKELQLEAARTVEALAKAIAQESGKRPTGGGRSGSARAEAEAQVAGALGVKPKTLAKQRERLAKKGKLPPPPQTEEAEPAAFPALPPPIETFGIDVDGAWLDGIREHQGYLESMLRCCADMSRHLTALERRDLPRHDARLQELRRLVTQTRAAVAGSKPTHLCPWCKGQQAALDGCLACGGTALVLDHQMPACPAELLETAPLVYYDHGSLATVEPTEDWGIE